MKSILAEIVHSCTDHNILIVVQTEIDRKFSECIHQELPGSRIIEEHDPLVLREIYRNVDVLITMRLHAGILAMSVDTPVIGIFSNEWGLKNPGIMSDFGMPYVIAEDEIQYIPAAGNMLDEDVAENISWLLKPLDSLGGQECQTNQE